MNILTRYTLSSIIKIAIVTILIFAAILAAVELFSKMDQIMHGGVEIPSLIEYIILSLPEYLMMVASISFLFAVTYFLSTLTANNEMIPILNAGVSPVRLRRPIILLAIVLTILGSLFQEHMVIAATNRHDELETELFGASSTRDSRNIVLTDDDGFLIYTQRFSETTGEIYNPVLVRSNNGIIQSRVEADRAHFDEDKGWWIFEGARIYEINGRDVNTEYRAVYEEPLFDPDTPALLTISEEERRMSDMMKLYMPDAPASPVSATLTLNSSCESVRKLANGDYGDDAILVAKYIYYTALISQRRLEGDEMKEFLAVSRDVIKKL